MLQVYSKRLFEGLLCCIFGNKQNCCTQISLCGLYPYPSATAAMHSAAVSPMHARQKKYEQILSDGNPLKLSFSCFLFPLFTRPPFHLNRHHSNPNSFQFKSILSKHNVEVGSRKVCLTPLSTPEVFFSDPSLCLLDPHIV